MNTVWKDKGKGIGKSGDLLLTRRSERRYAERGNGVTRSSLLDGTTKLIPWLNTCPVTPKKR